MAFDDYAAAGLSGEQVMNLAAKVNVLPSQARDLLAAADPLIRGALLHLIGDLTDDEPCWFDHHGYCQAHGWMATDPTCPDGRAKELLSEGVRDAD